MNPALPPAQPASDAELAALLDALRSLPQLDLQLGLLRTQDKPAFYVSMLRRIVASQQDAGARMAQCMAAADWGSAERIAHTLSGLAGNVGATRLQASAAALEKALEAAAIAARHGNAPADALADTLAIGLADTRQHLAQLVEALSAVPGLLPPQGSAPVQALGPVEREQALQAGLELRRLLQDSNAAALEWWEAHAPQLRSLYARADGLEKAIRQFDFDEALDLMDRMNLY